SKGGPVLENVLQAVPFPLKQPLVAQNGTFVRYEAYLNRPVFDMILGTASDPTSELFRYANIKGRTQGIPWPSGSIIVKSAWREIGPDDQAAASTSFTRQAILVKRGTTQQCEQKTVALVGFHVMQRTPKREHWVWSTFEHVANVPDPAG